MLLMFLLIKLQYKFLLEFSSGQLNRNVLERVNLPEVSEVLSKWISEAVKHNSGCLSLEGLTFRDRAMFGVQVRRIADSLVQAGPNSLATPSIHENLVASIRKLQSLVEQSVNV